MSRLTDAIEKAEWFDKKEHELKASGYNEIQIKTIRGSARKWALTSGLHPKTTLKAVIDDFRAGRLTCNPKSGLLMKNEGIILNIEKTYNSFFKKKDDSKFKQVLISFLSKGRVK